jgi:lipid II:glycine glycyltransferase (peptidoglycan interpeptide bridge formation enzyme)
MHFLLWRAIQEAKASGLHFFDFGRTEAAQHGLVTFKKRWGTTESSLIYSRYGLSDKVTHMFESSAASWKSRVAKYLLAHMQPGVLSLAGRALYRHVG